MSDRHPFEARPGYEGVIVRYVDRSWYLREWHSHDRLEMNLVVRGHGSILLEDRRYSLMPGHLVWLWPGQRHVPASWSGDMLMWIIEWDHRYYDMLRRARRRVSCPAGEHSLFACRRLKMAVLTRLEGVLAGVAAAGTKDAFNIGLRFLLLGLWDEFAAGEVVEQKEFLHPGVEKVLAQLNDPYDQHSLAELADLAGLSPHYLSTLFQQQTGMTIPHYRNRIRLNRFFHLHRSHPEQDMLALALDAGFGSYAQFYRVFRQLTGQTPRQWSQKP
jgi:AraC-like DNA-binding protein